LNLQQQFDDMQVKLQTAANEAIDQKLDLLKQTLLEAIEQTRKSTKEDLAVMLGLA